MGLLDLIRRANKKEKKQENTQNVVSIAEFNGYKNKLVYAKEEMDRYKDYEEHKGIKDNLKFKQYISELGTVTGAIRQIEYKVASGDDISQYMEALKKLEREALRIRDYADTLGDELPSEGRTQKYVITEDRIEGAQQRQFNSLEKSRGNKCDYGMKYLSEDEYMFIVQTQGMYVRIRMAISLIKGNTAAKKLDMQVLMNVDISTLRELAYEMNLTSKDSMVNLNEAIRALIPSDDYHEAVRHANNLNGYFLGEYVQYRILYKTIKDLADAGQERAKLSTVTRYFLENYTDLILRQRVNKDSQATREYTDTIMSKIIR